MTTLVFYHDDQDGWTSGYIMKKYINNHLNRIFSPDKVYFTPIQYGYDLDKLFKTVEGKNVILLDFSIQPISEFIKFVKITNYTLWIDHHKSVIDDFCKNTDKFSDLNFDYSLKTGIGACELTYEYLYGSVDNIPQWIKMISNYDVWKWEWNDLYLAFYLRKYSDRARYLDKTIFEPLYTLEGLQNAIKEGEDYFHSWLNIKISMIDSIGFETEIEGYPSIAVNGKGFNSMPFEYHPFQEVREKKIWCSFFYTGKKDTWVVSLYSQAVDVSEIAKKYGGGGHQGAAGFQCSYEILSKFLNLV